MSGTPQFVDMSQFQPEPINWPVYKAWSAQWDGISRVAMRSSYGNAHKDPVFDTHRANALNVGIDQIFYYHYSYPSVNAAVAEANSQHSIVGAIRPQDLLILDFEENVADATSAWALAWLQTQEANYGKLPGIYASSAYIASRLQDARLARYPLWLANWQYTPNERPAVPSPWTSYEFVQYTDKATNIPGVPGTVDCNIFLGVTLPIQEESMSIDLTDGTVASHFSGGPDVWKCKDNGFLVGYGILGFYKTLGGDALCGLTYLGLPKSNELSVAGHAGVTVQEFERASVRYDPQHQLDNPPGSGDCYLIHVEQDPRAVAAQSQIATLQKQITDLEAQVVALQPGAAAAELTALQAKIAQAVKEIGALLQ